MIRPEKYGYALDLETSYNQPITEYKEKKSSKNKHKIKNFRNLYVKTGVVLFIYGIILVCLTCQSASLGYQIVSLEKEVNQLYVDNAHLNYDIAQMSSLAYIESKAKTELGMKNPDMNVALTIPVNIIEKNSVIEEDDNYLEQDAPMKPLEKFYSALLLLSDKSQ